MVEIKNTASEKLAQIKRACFKGAGLAKACVMKGEERRTFVLSQVERLLTPKLGYELPAMWLSDRFWTADEGRKPIYEDDLLMTPQGLQTLTDKERGQLELIKEIAGLCHDLSLHFTFDLKEAFGFRKNDFWMTNKQLVEWLATTEYERIAMHVANIMRKHAINVYAYGHYQPAQDALAELFSMEYSESVREPNNTKMPARGYVKAIIDALQQTERHWQRGRRLKLNPELVMLHDEIYGVVPRQFDKGVLAAAQALYDYMDTELCGRLVLKDHDYDALSWSELPESVRRDWAEVLGRFAEKVREVRDEYLAKGWVTDDSLAFGYLMAHAQRCGQGLWREDRDAL